MQPPQDDLPPGVQSIHAAAQGTGAGRVSAPPKVPSEPLGGTKLLSIRLLNYLTNYVVNRLPSYQLRHFWYRRILGITLGSGSAVFLGCYIWFYGPGQIRRTGLRI